jgi:uncharacterized protein (DUF58 family)
MSQAFTQTPRPLRRVDDLIDSELMVKLDQLDVISRKIFAGKLQGERRSKKRGQSVEFADFRQYVAGDDLRFIDWNIYARLDRLFLKLFLEEEDLSLQIVVDASQSMRYGRHDKLDFSKRLAMALGYIGLVNHNRVTLSAFGGDGIVTRLPNLRGRRRTQEMGRWLLDLEPSGESPFTDAMRAIALARQGKGVMVILSDFMLKGGYERGLRYLVGGGYDTFAMQVLAPEEMEPDSAGGLGGDLKLTDIEDEDVAEVTVSAALIRKYKENLAAYCDQLRNFCVRRSMTHLLVRTDQDLEALMLETLRRRGLLK